MVVIGNEWLHLITTDIGQQVADTYCTLTCYN